VVRHLLLTHTRHPYVALACGFDLTTAGELDRGECGVGAAAFARSPSGAVAPAKSFQGGAADVRATPATFEPRFPVDDDFRGRPDADVPTDR